MNRSGQPRPNTTSTANASAAPKLQASASGGNNSRGDNDSDNGSRYDHRHSKVFRWSFIALLFSATALFVAMLVFLVFGVPSGREDKYIAKTEYQAVFVNVNGTNGGQVYFGHITNLTPQFIRLTDVFYIQNQQSTDQNSQANGSYNLVKLGCELHGPEDEMLINRSEVFFWENLKSSSQVAQKAAEFYKQNPSGQKCSSTTNSTQQSSGTGATTGTTTTPTPSASTTTPTPAPATTTPPAATTKKP